MDEIIAKAEKRRDRPAQFDQYPSGSVSPLRNRQYEALSRATGLRLAEL
jgi:hypothetical protein